MPSNPSYIDLAVKRQVMLERLKSGQVQDFAKEIRKIETLLRQTLLVLEEEVAEIPRTQLNRLLSKLQKDQAAIFKTATNTFSKNLADISALYMTQEVADLKRAVDLRGTKLDNFTKKAVFAKAIKRPLTTDGELLEPWIKKFTGTEIARVNGAVRAGWSQGRTNQQIVQSVIGTKARNYKDGVLQTTRRNASTVVRTSVQHVASAARQETWEANKDVIDRYEFLATLDRSTSSRCRSLDGEVFEFGKGPIPPIHPNCRSTTIPVLNEKYSFLSNGRTRSGETGPVSADKSYYDWLKDQPENVQKQVLGAKRAALFRDGGMTAERFRELQFDKNFAPMTLDEMRKLEPEAFKKAGLSAKATPATQTAKVKKPVSIQARTIAEIEEKARGSILGLEKVDLGGIDIDVANDIVSTLATLSKKYDLAVPKLGDTKRLWKERVTAPMAANHKGIRIDNAHWAGVKKDRLLAFLKSNKHTSNASKDTVAYITHEFGHVVQFAPKGMSWIEAERIIGKNMKALRRKLKQEGIRKELGNYAWDGAGSSYPKFYETWAEAFSAYETNPASLSQATIDAVEKTLREIGYEGAINA